MTAGGLLEISQLVVSQSENDQPIVRGVDLNVDRGERVGLVGESGSGKTLTSLSILGLLPDNIVARSGRILFDGIDIRGAGRVTMDRIRGARIAMVYQNPLSSLNPVRTVGWQIAEAITTHESVPKPALTRRVADLLAEVGIDHPKARADDYPHQFSGGMRQRVVIAMALAASPDLLVADEPTTALDVTTQARTLALLDRLAAGRGMGVLFVTHDLAVAAAFCDRVDVMYAGRIVESGPASRVTTRPSHPYAEALVNSQCTFDLDPDLPIKALGGQPPTPGRLPSGCAFHPRCAAAVNRCEVDDPRPEPLIDGRLVACHVRAPGPTKGQTR